MWSCYTGSPRRLVLRSREARRAQVHHGCPQPRRSIMAAPGPAGPSWLPPAPQVHHGCPRPRRSIMATPALQVHHGCPRPRRSIMATPGPTGPSWLPPAPQVHHGCPQPHRSIMAAPGPAGPSWLPPAPQVHHGCPWPRRSIMAAPSPQVHHGCPRPHRSIMAAPGPADQQPRRRGSTRSPPAAVTLRGAGPCRSGHAPLRHVTCPSIRTLRREEHVTCMPVHKPMAAARGRNSDFHTNDAASKF